MPVHGCRPRATWAATTDWRGGRSSLLESAKQRLAGLLEISPVEAGLQTVGWLCGGMDGEAAARAAEQRNVDVTPLSRYGHGRVARDGLQLGFAAVDTQEIRRGVRDLAVALQQRRTAGGGSTGPR